MVGVDNNKQQILEDAIELLTLQMIKNKFQNKSIEEEKFVITKQELYEFSIKLIKVVKEVYDDKQ